MRVPDLLRSRSALLGMLLLLVALVLAIYVVQRPPAGAARGPIVIGLLQALNGSTARSEAPLVAATRLAVEEINAAGGLLGRPVELRIADVGPDRRAAAAAAARFIDDEQAVALFGCWASSCREGAREVVEARRHLLFYPLAYEGMEQSPHIVYTGPAPNQQLLPGTAWALQRFGRRVYLVGTDGLYSHRVHVMLRDFIRLSGGEVVGESYLSAWRADADEAVRALKALRPDVVLNTTSGDGNGALFDALVEHGLGAQPLMSFRAAEPEMHAFGGGRLDRHFTAWSYLQSLPGAANEDFLARLRRSQGGGAEASDPAVSAYVAVKLWAAAVREVGSVQTAAVNANVPLQSVSAPHGFASVEGASRHLWRQLRIAQVRPDGQLQELLLMPHFFRPEAWPAFRSTEHWMAVMRAAEVRR